MPVPKKGPRVGGSASHQKLMWANMAAPLFVSEGMVTTEAKAKALRPLAEQLITKGGLHQKRQVMSVITDRDVTAKLFSDIGPRYAERTAGTCASSSSAPARVTAPPWRGSSSSRALPAG